MRISLEIYELKVLKGPDRLLRLHAIISDTEDLETELYMMAAIIDALIYKHHNKSLEFPVNQILDNVPKGDSGHGKFGEWFNGKLGVEILIRSKLESSIKMRYYPLDLEIERSIFTAGRYLGDRNLDIYDYEFKYGLLDQRNGCPLPPIETKIKFIPKNQ